MRNVQNLQRAAELQQEADNLQNRIGEINTEIENLLADGAAPVAAARRTVSAAQRSGAPGTRRNMSPAGRLAIQAAQKARWARYRKANKK
jgi:hypothetical protein